ncbi:MAG: extracellular solute-binding protein [Clostridiales bacterium]|jgi:arabinogalactan oligomer/maltooligosaccharide transport system substrate-binding protein|nr:extracellular solute-binding protein [Clostridiales bacterium]
MKMKHGLIITALLLCAVMLAGCVGQSSPSPAPEPAPTTAEPASDTPAAETTPEPAVEAPPPSDSTGEPVTLKVWVPQNQITPGTIDKMQQQFQELHPEWAITFTTEVQGEDTAKTEILKDVSASGDVFMFANDQIQELIDAGAIAQLGGSTEQMVRDTMPTAVVDTVTVDGKLYGIPFTHNTFFMFYDKTILTAEDVTSLEKIMAKETPDNVYNFQFDPAGGWKGAAFYYGAGLTVYGADAVSYSEGCNWNNPTGIAVTNYLIDLINAPKCVYADDAAASELAAEHRLGAWWDGSWNYGTYKEALGDDLGLAILPTFNPDGNDYQLKGFYGSKAIGVNRMAPFPQVAVAFAAFLGSQEMQQIRFEETQQVPTNTVVGDSPAVQADEVAAVIVQEAALASVAQPTNANFGSKYWSVSGGLFAEIKGGTLTKDNVQEKMDTFVEALKVE